MSTIYVNNILPTTGDTSTVSGSFKVTGSMQVTGNVFMAGNLTVEGTTTTVNSTAVNITSSLTFEGPADAHETTLHAGGDGTGAAPGADTTIYLPAMSAGSYYLPVLAAASTTSITSTPEELNLLDGSSAGTVANSKGVIYSSAGAVHTSIIDGGATVTLSGSTDVRVENDLRLDSDSSVLSMGIGNDATLTHDGTTGLTIAATPVSVNSTGNLTLDSTTDIVLSGSSEVRVENDLRLDSDSAVFSMGAGDDFTITHDGTTGVTIKGEPIVVQKAATTAGAHQEIMRLEIKDEGVDMNIGNGPGIDFYVGETGGSNYGGTVAVIREEASDADSDAAMVFHTATDDQVPSTDRERMRITSAGKVGIGLTSPKTLLTVEGAVTLKEQSAADSDTAAYGQLWVKDDTPNALYFTTDAGDDIQITSGTSLAATGDITGVTAGDGLSGGGTSGGVSLALDLDELTGATIADGDSIVFIDANDSNASRKETLSDFLDVVAGTVATTGLDRSGATLVVSDLHPVGVNGAANQLLTDDGDGTVSSEGNLTFNGSILKVVGALSGSGTSHVVGAATFGNHVSMTGSLTIGPDSDGTDRTVTFGHSTLKTIMGIDDSADAFVINTDASFDGTLASNSLSIDASHNMIVAGNITGKGRVLVDDATEATSTTDGSLQTDGGLSVAKSAVIGDDLDLLSEGAIISFGTDKEITLTHEADVGLILEGNGQSADPTLTIKNTNADATGGSLKFLKDGSSVADADVIGNITFVSEDDGSNAHTYASIIGSISDMTAGAEGGKLQFNVAEHDGTVTQGLLIADGDADGEIDVTVGAGAASVVTVPGVLSVANDIILDDGGSIKEGGGTAAITIDGSGNVTKIGQDSPSSGEFLKYDGSKWVADSTSGGAVSAVANGSNNRIATFSSSDALNGEANLTFDGTDLAATLDTATFTSANSQDPLIIIKNTTNDANGARLQFVKDKGAAGADGDDIGVIEFVGDDAAQTQTTFAKIVAEVSEADNTDEAGKLSFFVAESDGTNTALTAGLILEGEHATDGEVDVTIGGGTASTTTIVGTSQFNGNATFGVDDTGVDVRFFSATASEGILYDASEDELGLLLTTKLSFHDIGGGENILASSNGHLEVNAGTTLDMTAPTTEIHASTVTTIDSPIVSVESSTSARPRVIIKNTTNDANAGVLRFVKDKGAAGAADDNVGLIEFYGDDANQDQVLFGRIRTRVAVHTNGQEGGKMHLSVASHDGELNHGLVISDGSAEDEVDVTIANGAASVTTTSGLLTATGEVKVGTAAGSGADAFLYTAGTAAHVGVQWDADGETEGILIGGADDHGVDFKFFGESAGKFVHWDMSGDELVLGSSAKISFNDAGGDENIVASADGHLEINSGTTLDMTAPTVDINASTAVTIDGPSVVIASSTSEKPNVEIKNTNADANGPALQFTKNGSSVADNDVVGNIAFVSEDDGSNVHMYSAIVGSISDMTAGSEGGTLELKVAEHDGTVTTGIKLQDGNADGEIDVTIGAGGASITKINGKLRASGSIYNHYSSYDTSGDQQKAIPMHLGAAANITSADATHSIVAPFDGRCVRAFIRTENAQNANVTFAIHKIAAGTAASTWSTETAIEEVVVSQGGAAAVGVYNTSGSAHFVAGDSICFSVDPDVNPGNVNVTLVLEYDTSGI